MTLVLTPVSDYYFSFTMPCGFNGDSVDFDSVVVESEFCAGDWALPSPVCAPGNNNATTQPNSANVLGSLHNLDIVGNFNFADQSNMQRRNNMEIEESSLVTDELKSRLLGKYDGDCGKMDTDEFDVKSAKSEQKEEAEEEDEDELFFQPPRRISMLWNSKLRWKEERKKVLKISINKLRRIEDPELFLCRSVLINNTVKRLHREIREEKMARYPEVHRPVPVSSCNLAACNNGSIPETFPRKRPSSASSSSSSPGGFDCKESGGGPSLPPCYDKENQEGGPSRVLDNGQPLAAEQDTEGVPPVAKRMRGALSASAGDGAAAAGNGATDAAAVSCASGCGTPLAPCRGGPMTNDGDCCPNSRRSPPAASPGAQQPQQPCLQPQQPVGGATTCAVTSQLASNDRIKAKCDQSRPVMGDCQREEKLSNSLLMTTENVLQATKERRGLVSEYEKQYSQYSCGQLSIFGELQSVVFHSLIASLES